jgi:hypothetical protein
VNVPELTAVDALATSAKLGRVRDLVPLSGGKNNRVFRVSAENGEAVLKAYFRHPADPRDRLGAEWAFSRFAWSAGVRCLPEPLACDPAAGLGLFSFVEGETPAPEDIAEAAVGEAAAFVRDLNAARWRPLASRLPAASEACFSIAEHLGTVARRVDRLADAEDPAAVAFVRRELIPAWARVRRAAESAASDSGMSFGRPLEITERCVSPSDFGFHNALIEPGGRVRFLDFEYAGWDDPAKLVCDFFCQPALPVPPRFFGPFAREVAAAFPDPSAVVARSRLLLPVYRVKWVCIRLNEFLPAGGRRRAFSLAADEPEARKQRQLAAAREALAEIHNKGVAA